MNNSTLSNSKTIKTIQLFGLQSISPVFSGQEVDKQLVKMLKINVLVLDNLDKSCPTGWTYFVQIGYSYTVDYKHVNLFLSRFVLLKNAVFGVFRNITNSIIICYRLLLIFQSWTTHRKD